MKGAAEASNAVTMLLAKHQHAKALVARLPPPPSARFSVEAAALSAARLRNRRTASQPSTKPPATAQSSSNSSSSGGGGGQPVGKSWAEAEDELGGLTTRRHLWEARLDALGGGTQQQQQQQQQQQPKSIQAQASASCAPSPSSRGEGGEGFMHQRIQQPPPLSFAHGCALMYRRAFPNLADPLKVVVPQA